MYIYIYIYILFKSFAYLQKKKRETRNITFGIRKRSRALRPAKISKYECRKRANSNVQII